MEAVITGRGPVFGVDDDLFLDALRGLGGTVSVAREGSDPTDPIRVDGEGGRFAIVMPMRL